MIIAQAQDLEQRFGGNTIFSNISFSVPDNARIGLVGPNGAGKTTLLKIMTGQQEPTSGQFTINKGLKVGYIAQENALDEDKTIWDEMLTVFDNLIEKNKRITKMQEQILNILKMKTCSSAMTSLHTTLNKKAALLIKLKLRAFSTVLILKKIPGRKLSELFPVVKKRALLL